MIDRAEELSREQAVARLARRIADHHLGHPVRVAIDGITASGKSTLARDLTGAVGDHGRPVI
ncbi:MAG: uridine kinase, partial [Solirubrobacteraceae bacterium]